MVHEVIQCSARTVHDPEALSLGSAIDRRGSLWGWMKAGEEVVVVNRKGRSIDKREFHMGLLDGE